MSKSKGLSMDPCGKPDITVLHIPKQVPTLRLCFQRRANTGFEFGWHKVVVKFRDIKIVLTV